MISDIMLTKDEIIRNSRAIPLSIASVPGCCPVATSISSVAAMNSTALTVTMTMFHPILSPGCMSNIHPP